MDFQPFCKEGFDKTCIFTDENFQLKIILKDLKKVVNKRKKHLKALLALFMRKSKKHILYYE